MFKLTALELGFIGPDKWVEDWLSENSGQILPFINDQVATIQVLDLGALPVEIRRALMVWLVVINKKRIIGGAMPIITLDLIKRCPIWFHLKIKIPIIELKPQKVFNQSHRKKLR